MESKTKIEPSAKRHLVSYPDYEESDARRVDEMASLIESNGGFVVGRRASEADGEALLAFRCLDSRLKTIYDLAEEKGWEVAM